ncbi:hypothetical protein [Aureibaculum luteum]|uniref:hypothetical protein n=1 Tax=Aureibaculum luteum TaxID=1548456 RepID=UPI000E47A113|nr:hypothetical protein [Aureibaculum luteum]
MKVIYLFITCFLIHLSISAQEITMDQLFEIVSCKSDEVYDTSSCFVKIVKEHKYTRLDYDKGDEGYTGSKIGARKMHYGPKSTDKTAKINSIYFLVFQLKFMSIIYTDDEQHFNDLYQTVSSSKKYVRMPNKEGSSKFKDWVYQLVENPNYEITFIKHPEYKGGDFSISVSRRW